MPAALNSPQYVITSLTTSSSSVTIEELYRGRFSRAIIDNTTGTTSMFAVSGVTNPTAVFPSSATAASIGTVVPAGTSMELLLDPTHNFIACIRSSGTATIHIKLTNNVD